ncbi:MAG: hypothetical protein M3409_08670 [Gemmatimonadota bacterium]|nr:hypothetical protein [Gemmatimonadota bacterium]
MKRLPIFLAILVAAIFAAAAPGSAQEWTLPTRQMPAMPRMAEMAGGWQEGAGAWAASAQQLSGVSVGQMRAIGDAAPRGDRAGFVRFTGEARPVATWADRNGDGRADMVELFRNGVLAVQVIDADYDGRVNAVRHFDASGKPVRTTTF